MRILHIIDAKAYREGRKYFTEFVRALGDAKASQQIFSTVDIPELSGRVEIKKIKTASDGNLDTFGNRIKFFLSSIEFFPSVVIKWGRAARDFPVPDRFMQMSFLRDGETAAGIKKSDYVLSFSQAAFEHAQTHGFSAGKTYLFPHFVYDYNNAKPTTLRDIFIPEKASFAYIAGYFAKNNSWEELFEALSAVPMMYFIISGFGDAKEYIEGKAQSYNIKSRCRFVDDPAKSLDIARLSRIAILPRGAEEQELRIKESRVAGQIPIAFDSPTARALIKDGLDGFILPNRDVYAIRKKLKDIFANSAEELAPIAAQSAKKGATTPTEKAAKGYIRELEMLLSRKRGRKKLMS
ncbi:MAG: glycosyltransferase [Alphaproteobacteria bacterium]|nr:glycosyltransferase [Alphaproteobacteria bacterium]